MICLPTKHQRALGVYIFKGVHTFQVEFQFGIVSFCGRRKTGVPGKNYQSKDEYQLQSRPTYGVNIRNQIRATLVGGDCSHHCAIPAPKHDKNLVYGLSSHKPPVAQW